MNKKQKDYLINLVCSIFNSITFILSSLCFLATKETILFIICVICGLGAIALVVIYLCAIIQNTKNEHGEIKFIFGEK